MEETTSRYPGGDIVNLWPMQQEEEDESGQKEEKRGEEGHPPRPLLPFLAIETSSPIFTRP